MSGNSIHPIIDQYFAQLSIDRGPAADGKRQPIGNAIGEGYLHRQSIRSGMEVIESNYRLHNHRMLKVKSGASMIELSFCIQGGSEFAIAGSTYEIVPGSCSLHFMQDFDVAFHYKGGLMSHGLGISLPVSLFHDYMALSPAGQKITFEGLLGSEPFRTFRTTMDAETLRILRQMMQCPYTNALRSMYMESKAMELLSMYMEAFLFDKQPEATAKSSALLSKSDRSKVRVARDILLNRMAEPPSLLELSRLVGLNDYKLKIGFKEQFGKSAFAYLREMRLEKAK